MQGAVRNFLPPSCTTKCQIILWLVHRNWWVRTMHVIHKRYPMDPSKAFCDIQFTSPIWPGTGRFWPKKSLFHKSFLKHLPCYTHEVRVFMNGPAKEQLTWLPHRSVYQPEIDLIANWFSFCMGFLMYPWAFAWAFAWYSALTSLRWYFCKF